MGCIKTTPNSDGLCSVMSIPAHSFSLSLSFSIKEEGEKLLCGFLKECKKEGANTSSLVSRKGKCGKIEEFRRIFSGSRSGKSGFVHLKATVLQ